MKSYLIIILAIGFTFFFSSCSVEKRLYSSGYHVQWHHKKTKQIKRVEKPSYKLVLTPNEHDAIVLCYIPQSRLKPLPLLYARSAYDTGIEKMKRGVNSSIPHMFLMENLYRQYQFSRVDNKTASQDKTNEGNKLTKDAIVTLVFLGLIILLIIGFMIYNSISNMSFGGTLIWI